MAEFCIAELGTVLGISTTSAKRLIGHALELRNRLPRLWSDVHAGRVPLWRARLVAEPTIHATPALTPASVGWIDAQITPFAARVGPAQLDRLVTEAITRQHRSEPIDPDDPHPECPDHRHVTIESDQVGHAGTTHVTAELDLADALDLATATGPASDVDLPAARPLELHLHSTADLAGGLDIDACGRLDDGQRLLLLETVQSWCGDSHTHININIMPVIDLTPSSTPPPMRPPTGNATRSSSATAATPIPTRPSRADPAALKRPGPRLPPDQHHQGEQAGAQACPHL